jgi:pimeloyl-ACP methyl ester carboxylesterase
MPRALLPTGIELEYKTTGDSANPTLLVVTGYGTHLISWRSDFIDQLAAQGLFVVQFDNRDAGLSMKLDGQKVQPMKVLLAQLANEPLPEVPYTLSDMAADGIGLLDHLGIERAHVVGNSMGGMIVQTMAIEHPSRIASVTSVMSSPGDPRTGAPTKEARDELLKPSPSDREEYIEAVLGEKVWASKKYYDPEALQALAAATFDRGVNPTGDARQLAAIYASGDRSEALSTLEVPMLVIHGRDDTLITPEGGEKTAELVSGSRHLLLSDMGHDMPRPLWPVFAEAIGGHIRSASVMAET